MSKRAPESKVVSLERCEQLCAQLRRQGQRIALTNGCFDLIHAGHVRYLAEAARLANVLVVGLNDDASVRELKGPGRPINGESDRALVLAALEAVDLVVLFSGRTASHLVRRLRPEVYVKGGDYTPETLPEWEAVVEVGAQARFIPLLEGRSTTEILRRAGH